MEQAIRSVAQAINNLKDGLSVHQGFPWADWIVKIVTVAGIIFGIYKIVRELTAQKQLQLESQYQKARDSIDHKLNNFFGPLKELSTESRILYEHFALKEKANAKGRTNAPHVPVSSSFKAGRARAFSTLKHLSQGNTFDSHDMAILKQIIDVITTQRKLIEKEGHIIENSQLASLLGKFGTHARLLALAVEGKLDYAKNNLESMVFPRELDGAIESEIRKLQDRFRENHPLYKKPKSLILSADQKEIIAYYDKNYNSYYKATAYIDLDKLYAMFLEHMPYGGIICDAGCGVGRDTRFFIKAGYRVVSFDASTMMVKLCSQYPFAYCIHKSFSDIDYIEEFDGVWAAGSLIHLSQDAFKDALFRISNAIKPGGILFFSIKKNNGSEDRSCKVKTYFYKDEFIKRFMSEEVNFVEVQCVENSSKKGNTSIDWISYFFKKPE